jgi:molecular chaperone DnaK (HSP70)
VLVGGPTQLPYIRAKLELATGISVDSSVNALTVVATGAAIFGKSAKIPKVILEKNRKLVLCEVKLDFKYYSINS